MPNTIMNRADISKAMYVGTKEVFMKHLQKNKVEQWKACCKIKESTGKEEKYDTVGNLKPAAEKAEGDPVVYGKIIEGNVTTLTNKTYANGFSVTMEAEEDEKWGIVPVAKTQELARTMLQLREKNVAAVWDGTLTITGADGVKLASTQHPLLDKADTYNVNLISKVFDKDVYEEGVKLFSGWYNHQGEKFDTRPTAILAHTDRQTYILAMLESSLVAFEASNTKNTIPKLNPIFNSYISKLMVHLIDEDIDSVVFQKRKGLTAEYDYDKRDTFNWYFNVHERYIAGCINPGFGFVTIKGEA